MAKMKLKIFHTLFFVTVICFHAEGQNVGIKTNILYDALLNANLGVEVRIAKRWTLDISGNYNGWTLSQDRRWKHWLLQPEARYWFCDRFTGHFIAIHAHGGQYNIGGIDVANGAFLGTDYSKLKEKRFQGWFAGAGIGYGYSWILSRHWNFELEIGIGYAYTRYDCYPCAECGTKLIENAPHHYFGLTKAAVNLIYTF